MTQHFGVCEWSFPASGPLAIQLAAAAGYEGMQVGEAGFAPLTGKARKPAMYGCTR